jgi:hypothetical protein
MPKHASQPADHIFQTTDFTVVATLLGYYGLPYSVRSLNDYLHHHTFGTLMTEMADCLLQHGLDSTLVSSNPELFSRPLWKKVFQQDFPKTDSHRMPSENEVERVIAKGVMLRQAMPSTKLIDEELKNERPVLVAYNPKLIEPIRNESHSYGLIMAKEDDTYQLFEPYYDNALELRPKKVVLLSVLGTHHLDPSGNSLIFGKERTPAPTEPPAPLPEI